MQHSYNKVFISVKNSVTIFIGSYGFNRSNYITSQTPYFYLSNSKLKTPTKPLKSTTQKSTRQNNIDDRYHLVSNRNSRKTVTNKPQFTQIIGGLILE